MTRPDDRTPAERLADAIAASGLNHREIARRLAGPGADDKTVEGERRNLLRWVAGDNMPSTAKAKKLAAILGGSAQDYRQSSAEVQRTLLQRLRRVEALLGDLRRELPE